MVVLDFTRHMDRIVDVHPEARLARARSGTVLVAIAAVADGSSAYLAWRWD